jgi:hypothetical protein
MTNNNTTKGSNMTGMINGLKWTKFIQTGTDSVFQTTYRGKKWIGFSKAEVENMISQYYGLLDCRYNQGVVKTHRDKKWVGSSKAEVEIMIAGFFGMIDN